jgi:aryl-alcohol dehydrogenase-like predicted oxidoreductase
METILLANTDISASRIALGTWAIGGWMWGGSDERDAIGTLHAALDHGINLIDTAPVYGFGRSEEIVGKALEGRRDRALIATKVGLEWRDGKVVRNSTPERLRRELDDTLRRLRTDYIDLYQIHWPDPLVPIEETALVMADFLKEGRIRAIGVSNYSPEQMAAFARIAPLHTAQPPYNLFERAIETDVLPYAKRQGITLLAYGALCRGLLTGAVSRTRRFEGDDLRQVDPKFREPHLSQYLAAVQALERLARERYGKSVLALAVRWILDQGPLIALWGARRPEQLAPVRDAIGWSLDAEALLEIDRIIAEHIVDPVGPEFMAPPSPVPVAGEVTAV